jgi:signal transduction histidine kinase
LLDSRGPDGAFRFQHRFAEPFESLRGDLTISPLQGSAGTRTIYWLVALLVLACAIGFIALDRMVSIALDFAQRRSNFVAAVSHELRTPLTAIRMYSEMLRDELVPDPAKQQEYYATMANEAERLSRLVENVLEFSRLENGQREVSPQIGDPTSLLRQTAETLAPHALESGLQIVFEADEGCPPVQYDRDAIVQMLFNLVDNAIKYAKKATVPEIRVQYHKKGAGTELSVRDFGPGVSKRHLRRIFEPFYRAQDERTREAKGTGIGLALVRELAQSMGAVVDAESPSDGGFRIAITLCASAET